MALRLLHTADWQIGKAFGEFEGDTGAVLRAARFDAVKRVAALAAERQVDAVLVAGDVFDTDAAKAETLHRTLEAMRGFSGPWVLLPGNHDPARPAGIWARLAAAGLPENVAIAADAVPILLADGRLAVLPAPLTRRHEIDDLTAWWDGAETPPGTVRVGLAHGAVTNRLPEGADANNPIADDRADRARLDYLALGDWHGTREIAPRTWYAGTPEPDRFRANAPGHALIVEIPAAGALPRVEAVRTARFAWHAVDHHLGSEADIPALDAVLSGLDSEPDRLVVSLALSGTLGLSGWRLLEELLERWRGRLRALRAATESLGTEPTSADMDEIDHGGFVRTAVETLRARAANPADPEATTARHALRLLHALHRDEAAGA